MMMMMMMMTMMMAMRVRKSGSVLLLVLMFCILSNFSFIFVCSFLKMNPWLGQQWIRRESRWSMVRSESALCHYSFITFMYFLCDLLSVDASDSGQATKQCVSEWCLLLAVVHRQLVNYYCCCSYRRHLCRCCCCWYFYLTSTTTATTSTTGMNFLKNFAKVSIMIPCHCHLIFFSPVHHHRHHHHHFHYVSLHLCSTPDSKPTFFHP